jgi:hypothetical protein
MYMGSVDLLINISNIGHAGFYFALVGNGKDHCQITYSNNVKVGLSHQIEIESLTQFL